MTSARESGGVLVYVVVFVALVALSCALLFAASEDTWSGALLGSIAAALVVAAWGLVHEFRRDLDAALTFCSVFLIIVAIFGGVYLASAESVGLVAAAITAVSGVLGLVLGAITFRRQRAPESPHFPNVLRNKFEASAILEKDGIQYTGLLEPSDGELPHLISFYLQNCFNAPRQVTVSFDAAAYSKYLRFHERVEVDLGPAEVKRVLLPVIAPTYEGQYPLYFDLGVAGKGGKRVRLWRAKTADTRMTPGRTAAYLAGGVFAAGGGVRFMIDRLPVDLWTTDLTQPEAESIWQPTLDPAPIG